MSKMLLNDQIIERDQLIDIEDRGYQFGDGIYEVIGVYHGTPFMMGEHFERLERSAREIQLHLPYHMVDLKKKVMKLIDFNNLVDGIVYLQVTRGISQRGHEFPKQDAEPVVVAYTREEESMTEMEDKGAKAILTEDIRWLRCDIKTLNLLPNVLAKQKAEVKGAIEAILHRENTVTEASSSNVFIVKSGEIYTHPANHLILNGITRRKVIEICQELDFPVHEQIFTVDDLLYADEVFITATKSDIIPIIQVGQSIINTGHPGQMTKAILTEFRSFIRALKTSVHFY